MTLLSLWLASQLAATPNDLSVVIARRDGVSKAQAQTVAKTVVAALGDAKLAVAPEPVDGLKCANKKPCLVAMGRKAEQSFLVLLEVGNVLDEGLIRAEAISVDEDGKRVALAEYQGALGDKTAVVTAMQKVIAPLKALTAGAPVAAEPVKPEPVVVAPPVTPAPVAPAPAPAVTTAPAPEAPAAGMSGTRIAGIILMGVGGAAAVGGAVFGTQALAGAGKVDMLCPVRSQCSNPDAFAAYQSAQTSQGLGIGLGVGAGVTAAAGLILFLVGGAAPSPAAPQVGVSVNASSFAVNASVAW